ncbi:hypothetical protein DIPPA_04609 [Diplonema papillatum]|nr:hypothetical protein DIPPA_04609 [Diplonema papillatum]
MLRRALPVALLAAAAAGLSLEAPTLLQCDGSDYSPAAHPRHSFAVRSGKAAYELRWAVGASFADAAERARLQPAVAMTGFDIAVADKLGGPVWSSTLNGTEPRFQLSGREPSTTYVWIVWWISGALKSPP